MKKKKESEETETVRTIGKLLKEGHKRDAVHIAVAPVIAGEILAKGDEVGFVYGSQEIVMQKERIYGLDSIGVIDPFLEDGIVEKGQRCWVFLFPGTVTGLRHEWTHPAFDVLLKPPANESEKWLGEFADRWGMKYEDIIQTARDPSEYLVAKGRNLHGRHELGADEPLFWEHVGKVLGRSFDEEHRERFGWSCSC